MLDNYETTAHGAFLYMKVAIGLHPSIHEAVRGMSTYSKIILPDLEKHYDYKKIQSIYEMAYQSLNPIFDKRAEVFRDLYQDKISEEFGF